MSLQLRPTALAENHRIRETGLVMFKTLREQLSALQELNIELVKIGADRVHVGRTAELFEQARALKERFEAFYVLATTEDVEAAAIAGK